MPTRRLYDYQDDLIALLPGAATNTKLCVFVHGYNGGYISTWSPLSTYLEINADDRTRDPKEGAYTPLGEWDYLFVGYDTNSISGYLDIAVKLRSLLENAKLGKAPFSRRYNRFTLVGHSLGTLAIRQLIVARKLHPLSPLFGDIHSVGFYGSPMDGSLLANISKRSFIIRKKIDDGLEQGSQQSRMLREWFEGSWIQFSRNETSYGTWPKPKLFHAENDWVVGEGRLRVPQWDGDDIPIVFRGRGHSSVKEPTSWDDEVVRSLVKLLS